MSKTIQYIASYFLLLCLSVSIVPFNLFHQHEYYADCDISNVEIENHPCHVSVYHSKEKGEESECKHDTHLTVEHEICEFCKFLSPRRDYYNTLSNHHKTLVSTFLFKDSSIKQDSFLLQNLTRSILGRAPPNC